ncbi:MAG: aminodeoxychorismate synthase component I [Deltaproteobacteria bacterium]|nr:aminodeoxychorismate synthase component I [Deltaproteobacteria bacterium]
MTISFPFAISGFHAEPVELNESFMEAASRFAAVPGTVLLMSGTGLDCARYHILGVKPWMALTGRDQRLQVRIHDTIHHIAENPFDVLRQILRQFYFSTAPSDYGIPIGAGLMGYFAYDLKDCLEKLPRTSVDDLGLPHICLYAPSVILIQDVVSRKSWICAPIFTSAEGSTISDHLDGFRKDLSRQLPDDAGFSGDVDGFTSSFTQPGYLRAIETIKEYIRSGDVYQVNMSQRFSTGFRGNPFGLFQSLYERNPAPFFAYVQATDHQIISTSPERFVYRNGDRVETRPIKGTRPRGNTVEEDARLKNELSESLKDDAELSMIVDLHRNDIGKVCRPGSVRVSVHKRVEAYQNVFHLVSDVEGILDSNMDSVDLLKATFPGGSITGCPKIRAMEIIDEMEPVRRHIYTGSIGYISFHDTLDLSIAIRTATVFKGKMLFSVGGGIVFDSNPLDEYEETLHKGKTLMGVFKDKKMHADPSPTVWIDGVLMPMEEACLPVAGHGLQYGYGLFETIRAVNGRPCFLQDHVRRFEHSWKALFNTDPPDITWSDVFSQVLCANRLQDAVAAVKMMAIKAEEPPGFIGSHLVVMARVYTHRLEMLQADGLRLLTYPELRQTPLAAHKTTNYLYYFLAGNWARESGGDEALILNPDGTVSETNTASLLLLSGKALIRPVSAHVLPGITSAKVCEIFSQWGFAIIHRPLTTEDLHGADHVLATNALMGAVPVKSLDGKAMICATDICQRINSQMLWPHPSGDSDHGNCMAK